MVRARVDSVESPDVDLSDPGANVPEGYLLTFLIGSDEEPSPETFGVEVWTPNGLRDRLISEPAVVGRHILIARSLSPSHAIEFLTATFEQCEGGTWRDVARQLAQIGAWEFDGYEPGE